MTTLWHQVSNKAFLGERFFLVALTISIPVGCHDASTRVWIAASIFGLAMVFMICAFTVIDLGAYVIQPRGFFERLLFTRLPRLACAGCGLVLSGFSGALTWGTLPVSSALLVSGSVLISIALLLWCYGAFTGRSPSPKVESVLFRSCIVLALDGYLWLS